MVTLIIGSTACFNMFGLKTIPMLQNNWYYEVVYFPFININIYNKTLTRRYLTRDFSRGSHLYSPQNTLNI